MSLSKRAVSCSIPLISTLLFLSAVPSILGLEVAKSVLSFATIRYPDAEFLSGFHTGCYWSYIYSSSHKAYSTWNPVLEGGYIKWTMRQTSCKLNPDGTMTGNFPDSKIADTLNMVFADNLVPVIEFTRVVNFEDAQKSWWDNFFNKWGDWMATNHPGKFFILSPAAEFNYPDPGAGPEVGVPYSATWHSKYKYTADGYSTESSDFYCSRRILDKDYPAMMQKLRQARDDAGLQDVIKIGVHLNYGWWGCDTLNEMLTNWIGFEDADDPDYYDGFVYGDIIGFSTYIGSPDSSKNPNGASWKTTLDQAWKRYKHVWEETCRRAGKTLPFLFFEYNVGGYDEYVTKEMVTYSYTNLLQNNPWVKGFGWYTSIYIEDDAIEEIKVQATAYDGYGAEGI